MSFSSNVGGGKFLSILSQKTINYNGKQRITKRSHFNPQPLLIFLILNLL